MAAIIETLQQEHADMARLFNLIEREVNGPGHPDCDLLHEIVEYCLTYPDQYHHPKEDLIYKALCVHDPGRAPAIDDLEAEHEELALLTREFATVIERARTAASDGKVEDEGLRPMARAFLEYYKRHMDLEESVFFPDAVETLSPEEWDQIEAQVTDPTDPMFRDTVALSLRGLLDRAAS